MHTNLNVGIIDLPRCPVSRDGWERVYAGLHRRRKKKVLKKYEGPGEEKKVQYQNAEVHMVHILFPCWDFAGDAMAS